MAERRSSQSSGRPRGAPARTVAAPVGERTLTARQRELLQAVEVGPDNVARFRGERIPDWKALKQVLEALGGTWKKSDGFRFPDDVDAAELVDTARTTGRIIDPKAADLFETPAHLADDLVDRAAVTAGMRVLEPSAGRGAIVKALQREFDRVVMNPPFSKRQDIAHVLHAFEFLRPGGVLVSVMSAGVEFREDSMAREFRSFVKDHAGSIERLPDGSFAKSGTMVRTVVVRLSRGAR